MSIFTEGTKKKYDILTQQNYEKDKKNKVTKLKTEKSGKTKIVQEYLDMDSKEFISKKEMIKRFPYYHDFVAINEYYEENTDEHRKVFSMSKNFFSLKEMFRLYRILKETKNV